MSAVTLGGVTLGYGSRRVLEFVSLTIAAGEFIGLLGPNGAGKTTLLRTILGLLPPLAGDVRVFGEPASRGNARVGYMPQRRTQLGSLRIIGRDVVASAAGGQRLGLPWPGKGLRREVDWALDMVDATPLARRPLGDLSGGERQRLLLAQALLGRPGLLLLDEPLISLDPRRQSEVVALARHLCTTLGMAVLFSAHELNPLLPAMDRVLYLGGGAAAIGTVDAVVTGPVLSRLYGAEIEVVRIKGRIFVMPAAAEGSSGFGVEHCTHAHEDASAHGRADERAGERVHVRL